MKWLIVLCLALFATSAVAVELNSAKPVKYVAAGGYAVIDSVANGPSFSEFEQWYLFQGQASEDIYIRRYFGDGWEDAPGVFIPSGKSMLINVPYAPSADTDGYSRQLIFVSTLTDSLMVLPWQR